MAGQSDAPRGSRGQNAARGRLALRAGARSDRGRAAAARRSPCARLPVRARPGTATNGATCRNVARMPRPAEQDRLFRVERLGIEETRQLRGMIWRSEMEASARARRGLRSTRPGNRGEALVPQRAFDPAPGLLRRLGRTFGLIHPMPADEATLIARVRQGFEPAFQCLEGRVAVEEYPSRVAAHWALP